MCCLGSCRCLYVQAVRQRREMGSGSSLFRDKSPNNPCPTHICCEITKQVILPNTFRCVPNFLCISVELFVVLSLRVQTLFPPTLPDLVELSLLLFKVPVVKLSDCKNLQNNASLIFKAKCYGDPYSSVVSCAWGAGCERLFSLFVLKTSLAMGIVLGVT